jgi:competence protein ComEC
LEAHYIDVGQGDSILVQLPSGQTILIDGGTASAGYTVVAYLNRLGVSKIDHLIATHPHEDHIGGLITVLRAIPIDKVYMPRATHTTRTFENLLLLIQEKGLRITEAKAGVVLDVGQGASATFVGPVGASYDNLNNFSAVLRISYGEASFLFTGDAEVLSEREMMAGNLPLEADVLKVGHHGSHTSTSEAFLKEVEPSVAVISVGRDNTYGHPHSEILARLARHGVVTFSTDINGTIIVISDGKTLQVKVERDGKIQESTALMYIGNRNSKIFHVPSCSSLPAPHNQVELKSRAEAIQMGFVPCKRCNL